MNRHKAALRAFRHSQKRVIQKRWHELNEAIELYVRGDDSLEAARPVRLAYPKTQGVAF